MNLRQFVLAIAIFAIPGFIYASKNHLTDAFVYTSITKAAKKSEFKRALALLKKLFKAQSQQGETPYFYSPQTGKKNPLDYALEYLQSESPDREQANCAAALVRELLDHPVQIMGAEFYYCLGGKYYYRHEIEAIVAKYSSLTDK